MLEPTLRGALRALYAEIPDHQTEAKRVVLEARAPEEWVARVYRTTDEDYDGYLLRYEGSDEA